MFNFHLALTPLIPFSALVPPMMVLAYDWFACQIPQPLDLVMIDIELNMASKHLIS